MQLNLTYSQQQALAAYPRKSLDAEKYQLAPSLEPIKEVLAMLEPPATSQLRAPPPSAVRSKGISEMW